MDKTISTIDGNYILIVNDQKPNLNLLTALLGAAGYRTKSAINGESALLDSKLNPPLLILLDIIMPIMDGFEVCRRLKRGTETKDIPIIFISALGDESSKIKAFELGGVDYISEPFNESEVLARVKAHTVIRELQLNLKNQNQILSDEINRRKIAEDSLSLSEKRYRSYIETTGQIAWVTNPLGEVEEDIPSFRKFTGQLHDEVKGSGWTKAIHPDDIKQTLGAWENAIKSKKAYETEYRLKRCDGIYRHLLSRGFPVFDQNGNIREWVGTCIDITERKEIEENLIIAKERAEVANIAKSKFLATMSHELRSPLTAVIGFSQVLIKESYGTLNSQQREFISDILTSSKHLLGLINDILDLTKADAGKMELNFLKVDLNSLAENSLFLIKEACFRRNITLKKSISSESLLVEADEVKIKQVIYNMLSNAVKFTPDGGVIELGTKTDQNSVICYVRDNGIGIDELDKSKVFSEFEQIDSELSRQSPGTGIGMPVSKRLILLHKGRMWFESAGKGQGTTFFISLPITMTDAEKNETSKQMFVWSTNYSINIKQIDEQHKRLLDYVSLLGDNINYGSEKEVLPNICNFLSKYTKFHFDTEENLMCSYNYPLIDNHLRAHSIFIDKVKDYLEKLGKDNSLAEEISDFVRNWLINHILRTDMELGKFLNSKGVI